MLAQYGAHKNGTPTECVDRISQGNTNCVIILYQLIQVLVNAYHSAVRQ
jgi:hypothetical protein